MTDEELEKLTHAPSREQIERFQKLTPEQRYHWWTDMLLLLHELATPEVRAAWRRHKEQGR